MKLKTRRKIERVINEYIEKIETKNAAAQGVKGQATECIHKTKMNVQRANPTKRNRNAFDDALCSTRRGQTDVHGISILGT